MPGFAPAPWSWLTCGCRHIVLRGSPSPTDLVLKNPVANPMLAFLVYRAIRAAGKPVALPAGWQSCHALSPTDDRMAELSPAEWMQRLPASFHDQVALSVAQVGQMLSSDRCRDCNPALIASQLYGSSPSSARVSLPRGPCDEIQACAVPWRGDISQASVQVIEAKTTCPGSIWVEFDDQSPAWSDDVGVLAHQLGAGVWIHPPQRKEQVDRCNVMPGAMRWLASSPTWDQWIWPLSDALGEHIAIALAQCNHVGWIPPELSGPRSRLSRWGKLPSWSWAIADRENGGLLGVSCLAMALAIQASDLPLR